jgi:hypothetical protein
LKQLQALIFVVCFQSAHSQTAGNRTFTFLDIPMTARAAAIGGNNMAIWGDDINLVYSNPALLNPAMHRQAALNYCNYTGDLNLWYLGYAHDLKKYGTGAISMQAFDYGRFAGYDEFDQKTTDFKAADYSINMTWAKPMADSMFNIGLALKTIISQYDIYNSFGNALDFGITWHNKKTLTISILARNVGYVWKSYSPGLEQGRLPYDLQLGISKKVEKAPFRLHVVYDNLTRWKQDFVSPLDTMGRTNSLGTTIQQDSTSFQKFREKMGTHADNFMRHITIGTEILITKNFNLRVGYKYRRQREMSLPERRGMNALSFGFGFRVKRFGFAYSFSKLAFAGNSSIFSLTWSW